MSTKLKSFALHQALNHSLRTVILSLLLTFIIGSGARFIFIDDNVMNMLPEDVESRRVWNEVSEEFGYSDFLFVAFGHPGEDALTPENLALTWDLTEAFERIAQVDEVISIATMNKMEGDEGFLEVDELMDSRNVDSLETGEIARYLKDNNNLSSRVLGKNKDYINIIIRPTPHSYPPPLVDAVLEITAKYEKDYDFHYGGEPYIAGTIPELIQTESSKLMLVGLLLMTLILLANLRSFPAVGMVLSVIFLSGFAMLGVMGWIFHFTDSPKFYFTMVNTSMPIVLLTIANSDGVHILSRFFREARKHKDVNKAVTLTMNQLMLPVFLTSITTSAAFLTMVTSPITAMTGFGVTVGAGILWAWILSATFLPAIIALKKWDFSHASLSKPSILETLIHRFGRNILKRPKSVLAAGLTIVGFALIGIPYINVEVNVVNMFKPGMPIRESAHFLDREMAGSMSLLMKIEGDMKDPELLHDVVKIQNYLESKPTVNTTVSIADVIEEMHKSIMDNNPQYAVIPDSRDKVNNLFTMYSMSGDPDDFESLVDYDYEKGLITAMMHSISTKETVEISNQIEHFIQSELGDRQIQISGLMMFIKDFVDLVVQSSITSIFGSIVVIFFIVWIFFRSWRFGILAIVPLFSAVILNFGLMAWFGVDLSHFTALLTSIIIGVGVDFAIHYIAEFRHYSENGLQDDEISRQVVDDVGYPILLDVFSNMGFGALVVSSLIPLVHMGGLMVFAMLSTSLGTLTILAALMEIFREKLIYQYRS
ncbi:MAG: MMPL family transporter [Candidatus Marinimicrobia bacterium]|nr:MMPL family transporter [Candidatus Neomarinimicrobiota bacterium]MDP6936347.1 MMPL family transporter [Candidatus Neomarinimicrobiota bacterium]